ncbi:MAG: hypothetical protein HYR60_06710 [Acidobacteria bacterium]|nr:hypothetical protein [Acidobacteriota bacterium]
MRQDADFFALTEPDLIYVARRLREAQALEEVLTQAGLDYLVEPDLYRGGFIFQSQRIGAFFYVHPDLSAQARELLLRNGYKPYVGTGP